jgi:hypothetical protein
MCNGIGNPSAGLYFLSSHVSGIGMAKKEKRAQRKFNEFFPVLVSLLYRIEGIFFEETSKSTILNTSSASAIPTK